MSKPSPKPRATTRGTPHCWHGAVAVGKRIVWTCGHNHHNRDIGGWTWGRAARDCASSCLQVALKTDSELAEFVEAFRRYNSSSSAGRRYSIDYELSVRDEIRRALKLEPAAV